MRARSARSGSLAGRCAKGRWPFSVLVWANAPRRAEFPCRTVPCSVGAADGESRRRHGGTQRASAAHSPAEQVGWTTSPHCHVHRRLQPPGRVSKPSPWGARRGPRHDSIRRCSGTWGSDLLLNVDLTHGVGQSDPDALCNLAGDADGGAAHREGLAIAGNRSFGQRIEVAQNIVPLGCDDTVEDELEWSSGHQMPWPPTLSRRQWQREAQRSR